MSRVCESLSPLRALMGVCYFLRCVSVEARPATQNTNIMSNVATMTITITMIDIVAMIITSIARPTLTRSGPR